MTEETVTEETVNKDIVVREIAPKETGLKEIGPEEISPGRRSTNRLFAHSGSVVPAGLAPVVAEIEAAVTAGEIPGAVLVIGRGDETLLCSVAGSAEIYRDASRRPMTTETLFDLASLTKVVATLPAVLRLAGDRAFGLDDRVVRILPEFSGGGKEEVTVRQLLTHTSGLASHREFFRTADSPDQIWQDLLREELEQPPGRRVTYSDLGYITLGRLISSVAGEPLDRAVSELVLEPRGLASTGYLPPADRARLAAATEAFEDGSARVGTVHDENAAALGGVAGHAGLFGTAADMASYLMQWCGAPGSDQEIDRLLRPELREEALRCQTEGTNGHRGLGWTARCDAYDHLGAGWPATAVGHTGFTGTSLGLEPVSGVWVVLLTNAVHFGRSGVMVRLRAKIHGMIADAFGFEDPVECGQ